ncbi:hypothetical protein AGIG_G21687 [Arapaima gigas]
MECHDVIPRKDAALNSKPRDAKINTAQELEKYVDLRLSMRKSLNERTEATVLMCCSVPAGPSAQTATSALPLPLAACQGPLLFSVGLNILSSLVTVCFLSASLSPSLPLSLRVGVRPGTSCMGLIV